MLENKDRKPYISVTGITNRAEANAIALAFQSNLHPDSSHQGALGYRLSSQTLDTLPESSLYADFREPQTLFPDSTSILNVIHYNTRNQSTLAEQVVQIFKKGGIYSDNLCRAIQLNIKWPQVNQLDEIKSALPDLQIVLSITPTILKRETREQISDNVGKRAGFVDFIIIDPSGNKGITFTPGWLAPYFRLLKNDFPDKQIILAGGFNDKEVALRLAELDLALKTKDFGIDAESGLKDGHGRLSIAKATAYIEKASSFFNPTTWSSL